MQPSHLTGPATGRPFNTPAMRALQARARRRPDLDTLRVWNNNEGPTLAQLVDAVPPVGGVASLIADMENDSHAR